jgi:hypothetical protein
MTERHPSGGSCMPASDHHLLSRHNSRDVVETGIDMAKAGQRTWDSVAEEYPAVRWDESEDWCQRRSRNQLTREAGRRRPPLVVTSMGSVAHELGAAALTTARANNSEANRACSTLGRSSVLPRGGGVRSFNTPRES